MARQDHLYVNLNRNLIETVDICVSSIFSNGAQVYRDRKDFVTKSIVNQIEGEKNRNPDLEKIVNRKLKSNSSLVGGKRVHVAKAFSQ